LAKIGHTLWYVATYKEEWIALLTFSGSALKCAARDRWIGWDYRHQCGRLTLIANNSRFPAKPLGGRRTVGLLPVAPIGVWIGIRLARRINQILFYRLLYAGMFLTATKLVWDAVR